MGIDLKSFAVGKANGGSNPVIESKTITENGTYTAPSGVDGYSPVEVNVPNPSTGKVNITDTNEVDVTNYAAAQVVDANLVAENIKNNVTVLGITGTHQGGITPTGTISITSNGTTDVTNYASANVNVPTSAPNMYLEMEYSGVDTTDPKSLPKTLKFKGNWEIIPAFIAYQNESLINRAVYNQFLTDARLEIPNTVKRIGYYAFYKCNNLATPYIPDSVTYIGSYAFQNCSKLALTSLPANLEHIGSYAFAGCEKMADSGTSSSHAAGTLTSLPSGLKTIGGDGCNFISNSASLCGAVQVTEFPATLESIEMYGCRNWYKNNQLSPHTVTFLGTPSSISTFAFNDCIAIQTVNVPWSQGAVSGAPWGFSYATINYNYTGE